ncbi:YceI family protein [Aquiflexum lacus]|uniref:YceI family protein n=1 Tax=Aquiflexum lacus TaxID=2483805 RepID=UPI001E5864A8|nr:YceI family protein [Aquiflexum lacus]
MMKQYSIWITRIVVFALVFVSSHVFAQVKYTLAPTSEMKISGGSTLHDWDMTSTSATGEGQFVMEGSQFKGIKSLRVQLEAETLKSGTRGLDNNAYKALDTKKHQNVVFTLKEITGSGSSYQAKGDFTISGVTKSASFPVKMTQSGGNLTFEGSYDTKLTNFSIDPPTALLGTVKTDDEITISFKTKFQPSK